MRTDGEGGATGGGAVEIDSEEAGLTRAIIIQDGVTVGVSVMVGAGVALAVGVGRAVGAGVQAANSAKVMMIERMRMVVFMVGFPRRIPILMDCHGCTGGLSAGRFHCG